MEAFIKVLKKYSLLLLLIVISIFICYQNYTPGTILSGWDTLHPEFNFSLYFQRITETWQQHQGLGAPPSQAHAAELPHLIILKIFSLFFPLNFVRYTYFFLMLILGPIGVFLFLNYIGKKSRYSDLSRQLGAFLGGLFYLLNIGTMQHFIVPLEMFATKYGYLGIIFLFVTKFIDDKKKKDLIIFLILIILSSPMAHTATLWYVFFIGLTIYAIIYDLFTNRRIKRSFLLLSITLIINLYWILPNIYYGINHSSAMMNSKINRLFTEDAYSYNKKYGNLADFLILKNFLFDWRVVINNGQFDYLLKPWVNHLNNPYIMIFAHLLSLFAFLGLIVSINKKCKIVLSFIPILIGTGIFMLTENYFISLLLGDLRLNSLIRELLRFPFTKFSLYYIFILSLGFGYFQQTIFSFLSRIKTSFYFYFILFMILCYALPIFQGNLISNIVRVKIPQEYFQLFEWSKTQDEGRIINLPFSSLFGWVYYRWPTENGYQYYQGAGFTWFGLKQPTLNREFDRWYPYNEQSYREFNYALNTENYPLFDKLLQKYRIEYLLLDENTWFQGRENEQIKLMYPYIKQLLKKLNIQLVFRSGKISVYKNLSYNQENLAMMQNITPTFQTNYIDQAFIDYGDYYTIEKKPSIIYPFRNFLSFNETLSKKIIEINDESYSLIYNFDYNTYDSNLFNEKEIIAKIKFSNNESDRQLLLNYLLPAFNSSNTTQLITLPKNSDFSINEKVFLISPEENINQYSDEVQISTKNINTIMLNNQTIKNELIQFRPEISGLEKKADELLTANFPDLNYNINLKELLVNKSYCSFEKPVYNKKTNIGNSTTPIIEYSSVSGSLCEIIQLPQINQSLSYLLTIEAENIAGQPFKFCLEDGSTTKCLIDEQLPHARKMNSYQYVIPANDQYKQGFNMLLNNYSVNQDISLNRLKKISIKPFPYLYIQSIRITPQTQQQKLVYILNQAYEKNWVAYIVDNNSQNIFVKLFPFLFGRKLTNHVLVNNWANGWTINHGACNAEHETCNVVIIFWPQYLEFAGFGLLIISFLTVTKLPSK